MHAIFALGSGFLHEALRIFDPLGEWFFKPLRASQRAKFWTVIVLGSVQ